MNNFNENEKLVDKWEHTGLLTECNDLSEKIQLSNTLEELADNLLHNDDGSEDSVTKSGILIPLAVRIFREGIRDINVDKLLNIVNKLYPKLQSMIDESYNSIDGEAEFVVLCQEEYIHFYGEKK